MADLTLVIANKNYSSWSLRPWLALKRAGLPFEEVIIPLDEPTTKPDILRYSPSGKVPCLVHGNVNVWESLAVCEYIAELAPDAGLWPADPAARALARAISSEMHGGFQALRQAMPMNIRASAPGKGMTPAVQENVNRIQALWRDCRKRFAGDKPLLFGDFTIADAMYAPVATRFTTYGVQLDQDAKDYVAALYALPEMVEWIEAAKNEPWMMPRNEPDALT